MQSLRNHYRVQVANRRTLGVGSRVAVYAEGDVGLEEEWPTYTKWMLDNVGQLRDVFQKHIDAL